MIRIKKPRCNRVKKFRNYKRLVEIAKLYSFDFRLDEECSLMNQLIELDPKDPSYKLLTAKLNDLKSVKYQLAYYFLKFTVRSQIKLVKNKTDYVVSYNDDHSTFHYDYYKVSYYTIVSSYSGNKIKFNFIYENDMIIKITADKINDNECSFITIKKITRK